MVETIDAAMMDGSAPSSSLPIPATTGSSATAAAAAGGGWVPSQYPRTTEGTDFRAIKLGPKGYKEANRKRHFQDMEEMSQAVEPMEQDAMDPAEVSVQPSGKRQKADEATYRPVSGKVWKAPAQRAALIMKPGSKESWDKKMEQRAVRKQFMDQKKEIVAAVKAKRKAKSDAFKLAKERKAANQQKSAVTQKVTNSSTLKKMMKSKKQKKLLKTADTN